MNIDWALVSRAVDYYQCHGFSYLEVPWICGKKATMATCPSDKTPILAAHPNIPLGYLAGSAEQSFIQMMLDGTLSAGKYVAATPCFRDDELDELHQRYFFKVELIDFSSSNEDAVGYMIHKARMFMGELTIKPIAIEETESGVDLCCDGIELGSYGYREFEGFKWAYGTGLALPRFSQVCQDK